MEFMTFASATVCVAAHNQTKRIHLINARNSYRDMCLWIHMYLVAEKKQTIRPASQNVKIGFRDLLQTQISIIILYFEPWDNFV